MDRDKSAVISSIVNMILENNEPAAKAIIRQEYPHTYFEIEKRTYTIIQNFNVIPMRQMVAMWHFESARDVCERMEYKRNAE